MNELVLTGCDDANFPISAMAAFGVLRLLTLLDSEGEASRDGHSGRTRLSWQARPRWTPVLHTSLTRTEVVRVLASAAAQSTTAPAWTTQPDLRKFTPETYRDMLLSADPSSQELTTAFACEWPVWRNGGLMLTPFFMTSGRQQWCESIREAASICARPGTSGTDAVEEALFGPWRYAHLLSALGWDPATERQHALEAQAPEKSDPRAIAAAVWLAAESLALFPCYGASGRMRTTSFDEAGQAFFWPVWYSPLTYEAVRAMLRLPLAQTQQGADRDRTAAARRELRARGIAAVFASQRTSSAAGHGYHVFRPAELMWSG